MQKALDAAWASRAPDLPLQSKDEALTLASIVEKETGIAEERPQIAGLFARRLTLGGLQLLQHLPNGLALLDKQAAYPFPLGGQQALLEQAVGPFLIAQALITEGGQQVQAQALQTMPIGL